VACPTDHAYIVLFRDCVTQALLLNHSRPLGSQPFESQGSSYSIESTAATSPKPRHGSMPSAKLLKTQGVQPDNAILERRGGAMAPPANLDDMAEADRALASKFGYTPVFKREFGYLSTFSFAVSIGGGFSSIVTTFIYPLEAGGSASVVWCGFCRFNRRRTALILWQAG
jgi:hypothetical protein